jgi:enoyl-CoA hydratase
MDTVDLPPEIKVEQDGPVRIITMNRPDKLNATNADLHRGLAEVWPQLAADTDMRAAVFTGAGEAFSAGGDIPMMLEVQENFEARQTMMREARQIVLEMIRFPVPVVAAVNGPAVGLGCTLVVLCDIAIMAEDAHLSDPHVAVGLVAGDGSCVAWPLATSMLRAKEFLLTGDRIPAQEALSLGLVNRVVPKDKVHEEALAFAHRLAGLPPQAVQETKRALNIHLERAAAGVLDFSLAAESESFLTPEHRERTKAFLERSKAREKG